MQRLLLKTWFAVAAACLAWVAVLAPGAIAQTDANTNGVSDVWEVAYGMPGASGADTDGDGFSDAQEAAAGTHPGDAASFPRSSLITMAGEDRAYVQFPTVPGMRYQVEASDDLIVWRPYAAPVIGDGLAHTLELRFRESFAPGGLPGSVWTGLTGSGVSIIKNYASNNTPAPAQVVTFTALEFAQSSPNREQFGVAIRGWIVPPASGSYTFWIASDDSSELWLSTNHLPAGRQLLASVNGWTGFREWTKFASQQSSPVVLASNRAYYLEVYQRESWGGDHLSVAWTKPGDAAGTRTVLALPHLTPDPNSLYDLAQRGAPLSFRLNVQHIDSDGDGVLDYEEHLLGLNPALAATTPRQPDATEARRMLGSGNTLTIGATVSRAYETPPTPAQFTVYRAGGIAPVSVPISVSGSAVSGSDYATLTGTLAFAAGQRTGILSVWPLNDALVETPETVTVTLEPGPGYQLGTPASSTVTIDDAPDVLYVAQMRAAPDESGLGGSGVGAVRCAGNFLAATINLSFNGLRSAQTGAEVFISSNGIHGVTACTLPLDQVSLLPWDFAATNGLTKQDLLAALEAGNAWMRIRTAMHPDGEVIGRLVRAPGWSTMPEPPAPPAPPVAPNTVADAARFLTQATFGPSDAAIAALTSTTYAAWIDAQRALPPTLHLPYVQHRRAELLARSGSDGWQAPRQMAWWQHALTAPDQLRQRMAWALSQILVVSQFGALDSEHEGITRYYDLLVDGAFGNYRDLLEDVTLSPMMGVYLSMMRNQKPDPVTGHEPDENYAREIMQLFTIGLTEMHNDGSYRLDEHGMPIPTYTQSDIVGLAHIFTGWSAHYDPTNPPTWSSGSIANPRDWFTWGWDPMRPMSFYGDRHDTLDRTLVGGHTVPGGTNGVDRLRQALDILFQHPNMGPFIARQLIQRFVTSNPSPGYIHRVASVFNDNGSGVRGDLGATIKAVLLDHEARSPDLPGSISFGKPIEPVMRITRMMRAFPPTPPFAAQGDQRLFVEFQWSLPEQVPQLASSVFNYYQPGYRHPGRIARSGLYSPEFQIFAETTAIREANLHYSFINWGIWTAEPVTTNQNAILQLNLTPLVSILQTPGLTPAQAQAALIDYLDDRFLFGRMSPGLRGNLESFFASLPGWYDYSENNQRQRARVALYLVLNSPEFLTQQ